MLENNEARPLDPDMGLILHPEISQSGLGDIVPEVNIVGYFSLGIKDLSNSGQGQV